MGNLVLSIIQDRARARQDRPAAARHDGDIMTHERLQAFGRRLKYRTTKWEVLHIGFPAMVLFMSYSRLFWGWSPWLSARDVIILVDAYLIAFLILAALRFAWQLPARQVALFRVPCLFLVLVWSFASRYAAYGHIERTTPGHEGEILSEPWDATYFSIVTLTTLGYDDYAPAETGAHKIVVGELLSGATLLLFLVPLLASHLALVDEPFGAVTTIGISRTNDGGWRIQQSDDPGRTTAKSDELTLTVRADGSVRLPT